MLGGWGGRPRPAGPRLWPFDLPPGRAEAHGSRVAEGHRVAARSVLDREGSRSRRGPHRPGRDVTLSVARSHGGVSRAWVPARRPRSDPVRARQARLECVAGYTIRRYSEQRRLRLGSCSKSGCRPVD
ncbi:hypothetical protein I552_0728 [Mycobacterium xenopi 3993]|nr:hypothetical protein I552_0728 [Mycobacterium xenopi 3993]